MHAAADEEVEKLSRRIHRAALPKLTQDTYRGAHNNHKARGVEHNKTVDNNHMTHTHAHTTADSLIHTQAVPVQPSHGHRRATSPPSQAAVSSRPPSASRAIGWHQSSRAGGAECYVTQPTYPHVSPSLLTHSAPRTINPPYPKLPAVPLPPAGLPAI